MKRTAKVLGGLLLTGVVVFAVFQFMPPVWAWITGLFKPKDAAGLSDTN
jgi:hypothetical protein